MYMLNLFFSVQNVIFHSGTFYTIYIFAIQF